LYFPAYISRSSDTYIRHLVTIFLVTMKYSVFLFVVCCSLLCFTEGHLYRRDRFAVVETLEVFEGNSKKIIYTLEVQFFILFPRRHQQCQM
jgi:hypothetical protein